MFKFRLGLGLDVPVLFKYLTRTFIDQRFNFMFNYTVCICIVV